MHVVLLLVLPFVLRTKFNNSSTFLHKNFTGRPGVRISFFCKAKYHCIKSARILKVIVVLILAGIVINLILSSGPGRFKQRPDWPLMFDSETSQQMRHAL